MHDDFFIFWAFFAILAKLKNGTNNVMAPSHTLLIFFILAVSLINFGLIFC